MFTYAGLLIIVPIFVFAIANYEATPARGVSTVADVVAYQKKAEETSADVAFRFVRTVSSSSAQPARDQDPIKLSVVGVNSSDCMRSDLATS
jgi:hypothetical protein